MVLRKHELEGKLGEERRMIKSGVLRDDNPLDQSPEFNDFLVACRHGDLRKCQELINLGVNINGKDSFDYTPLIIASLCGHYELVRLLLESGALAERNTFQGERCIYNALNDRIRNLLLQYDFSKTSDPYLYWSTHISGLLARTAPPTSDICLIAGHGRFHLHKFLLAARTPYFRTRLEAQPDTAAWSTLAAVPVEALQIALRHVYLGDLPRDLVPAGSPAEHEEDVARGLDRVSKQLGIPRLWEAFLASSGDRRLARQRYRDEEERALKQIGDFFHAYVLGGKMVLDPERVCDVRFGYDNAAFADVLLRADEAGADHGTDTPPILNGQGIPVGDGGDGNKRPKTVLYPAHKAMLIRSPYFERMFSGEYVESQTSAHLRVVTVDCSPAVLELVLGFLYTESVTCPLEHALDLLYAADMLFLDGLKSKAAVAISTLGSGAANALVDRTRVPTADASTEPINIYDVIHAAWDLRVQRLEEFAARYLAGRLEDYIDDPDFHDLIRQSADRIRRREETDSIELLDDIRYYLSERFRLRFEDAGLQDMLTADPSGGDDDVDPEFPKHNEPPPPSDKGAHPAKSHAGGTGQRQHQEAEEGEQQIDAGAVRTLDGDTADDEFASDAINYDVLLGKIDAMLDSLKLDA
ncbi:BTB/POZ domain-containing protein [Hirsutella rhossiliensis]|uniref:BTB/POZ domain-containing protein n=1 Tax=Hirsutella rhossiliensis TaxID=111463 RepID=A0A9P8MN75_9HYPO|nr:BTB/POZ domain-containing protein [Hirsutella rhossiliensis]KAH0958382.1 BTB/POZ domain-containing protein [Hirsutella rhossiliensis]